MFGTLILLGLLAFLCYEVWNRRKLLQLRDQLGLAGPPVHFLQGNVDYFYKVIKEKGAEAIPNIFPDMMKEYGSTFGFYRGSTLEIISGDPDVVKELFVTNFSNFVARKSNVFMDVFPFKESLLNIGEHGSQGVGWRDVRSAVSAVFSPGKIKKMHPLMGSRIEKFVDHLTAAMRKQRGRPIDVLGEYQAIMMDITGVAIFGREDTACVTDRSSEFYTLARAFMGAFQLDKSRFMQITYIFPFLIFLRRFSEFGRYETALVNLLSDSISQRSRERAAGKSRDAKDLIDLLLEESDKRAEKGEVAFTHEVLVSNCWAFFLAGYETSSSTLSYLTHLLGSHETVQCTLYEEIREEFPAGEAIDIERLLKLPYLHAVFCETLRRYPPAMTATGRTSARDTTLAGKYPVPAGVSVVVPLNCVLWNDAVYENALEFRPDRFFGEKTSSFNFLPFGIGPRNCVGARLAETIVKTIIASLLMRFHVRPDPENVELKVTSTNALLAPLGGKMMVILEERTA